MMFNDLKCYLDDHFDDVEGWCIPHLFQCITACREYQAEIDLQAPIAEIGVYHGKFFIGLAAVSGASAGHHAIDVFDLQQFNLDGAGKGNLEKFENNLKKCGYEENQYKIFRTDSMTISRKEIDAVRENTDLFSFFSIDGCHMVEHTINDIRIALELTDPRGIILVDDYNNPNWPGVQEGVSKLYFNEAPVFVPLIFTSNKLFLCHISYQRSYLKYIFEYVSKNFPSTRIKKVKRFGYETLTITPNYKEAFEINA